MLAELAAAGIGAGASVWGAGKAADAQEEASKRAIALQYEQMRRASNLYRPYREAGEQALTDYQGNIGDQPTYENTLATLADDPGYQFRLEQGQNTLENSAAARGNLLSGATLKDLTGYAQGMASQEGQAAYSRDMNAYNNQQNQLANLMQMGFNSVSGQVGQQAQSANNLANLALQGGQNQANYYTGIGNVANQFGSNALLAMMLQGGGAGGGNLASTLSGSGASPYNQNALANMFSGGAGA
jgi:hypothetical protein